MNACRPSWMVTLAPSARFDDAPPRHRHTVPLQWIWRFEADRCADPD